jgi:hypothetical protein
VPRSVPCPEGAPGLSLGLNGAKIRRIWTIYSPFGAWLFRATVAMQRAPSRRDGRFVSPEIVQSSRWDGAIFFMIPGTSCLATIMLSLWDKIQSPRRGFD